MIRFRIHKYRILLAISILSLILSYILLQSIIQEMFEKKKYSNVLRSQVEETEKEPLKTILMWNKGYLGSVPFGIAYGGPEVFEQLGCEVTKCLTTTNKSLLANGEKADAIIFNMHGGGEQYFFNKLPQNRSEHQRYIFWANESPMRNNPNPRVNELADFFNWTMTYRLDSDFVRAYGTVLENEANPPPKGSQLQSYIENFGRFNDHLVGNRSSELKAAWFVSNCNAKSGRQYLVREIQKFMRVDIYGKCGNFSCPKERKQSCLQFMAENYKFYFSLENSLCKDYVTEKLFIILRLQPPVIPIVLGGANYSKFVPEHSVINLDDFDSAVEFVNYLRRINDNPNQFAEYFWWKEHYRVNLQRFKPFCDLCKRLHKENEPKSQWKNVSDWWFTQAKCHKKLGFHHKEIAM